MKARRLLVAATTCTCAFALTSVTLAASDTHALAQLRVANSSDSGSGSRSDPEESGALSPSPANSVPSSPAPSPNAAGSTVTMSLQVTMLFVVFVLLLCLGVCCSVHALCRRYACCGAVRDDSFVVLASSSRSRSRGGSCFREDLLNDDELLRLWICWYCDFANYEMKLQCALCGNDKREKDAARKLSAVRPASLLAVSSASFAATTGLSFCSSSSSSSSATPPPSASSESDLDSSSYFTPSFLIHAPLETLPESPSTNNSGYTLSSPPGSPPPRLSAAASSTPLSPGMFTNTTHRPSSDQQQQQHESFSSSLMRRREWRTRVDSENHVVWSRNVELLAAAAAAAAASMSTDASGTSKSYSQDTLPTEPGSSAHSSFSSLFQIPSSPKSIEPIVQATAFVSRLSMPSSRTSSSPTTRYQHPHGVLRLEPAENARVYAALETQSDDPMMSSLSSGVGEHAVESVRAMSFPEKHRWLMQETSALLNVRWDSPGLTSDTTLLVARDDLLSSSVHGLMRVSQKQLHRPLRVQFANEPGVDAGGIVREWFGLAVAAFLRDATGLFQCVHTSDDGLAYTISQNASITIEAHLLHLRAFGRLLGKALLEGHLVAAPLTDVVFKHILGAPISFADLQAVDRKLAHSLQLLWDSLLTDGDPESGDDDPYALDFSIYHSALGTVDLKPNGRNVKVTECNKKEYVALFVQWHLANSVTDEISALVRGVYDVVPAHLLAPFDYQELRLLLCGSPTIDVDDWEAHTVVAGKQTRAVVRLAAWFWRAVRALSPTQQSRVLQFATGSARVPILGFKALTASDGRLCPFTIYCFPKAECTFLRAYTCFNRLDLPLYKTEQELENALALLLEMDVTGFSVQ